MHYVSNQARLEVEMVQIKFRKFLPVDVIRVFWLEVLQIAFQCFLVDVVFDSQGYTDVSDDQVHLIPFYSSLILQIIVFEHVTGDIKVVLFEAHERGTHAKTCGFHSPVLRAVYLGIEALVHENHAGIRHIAEILRDKIFDISQTYLAIFVLIQHMGVVLEHIFG